MVFLLLIANAYALIVAVRRGHLPAFASWCAFGVISCMVYNPWSPTLFTVMAVIGFALRAWLSIECVRLILPESHRDLTSLILAAGCIGALLLLSVAYILDRDYAVGVMLSIYLAIGLLGWLWAMIGTTWLYSKVSDDWRLCFVLLIGMEFLSVAIARISAGHWAESQSVSVALRAIFVAGSGYLLQRFENPHRGEYR